MQIVQMISKVPYFWTFSIYLVCNTKIKLFKLLILNFLYILPSAAASRAVTTALKNGMIQYLFMRHVF